MRQPAALLIARLATIKMRAAILTLFLIFCPTVLQARVARSPQKPIPASASSMLERALAMSKANRGPIAITLMQEAIRIYPDYFAAHLALGNELAKAGRANEALAEFENARRINPASDEVYRSVGLLMMQLKKYDLAASVFADAAVLNRNEPLHHLMRGAALVREAASAEYASPQKRAERDRLLQQADVSLGRAFELSGNRLSEVYLYRAMSYEITGAREEAAAELEKYLATKNPDGAEAERVREAIKKLRGQ